ncbi:MAG: hypothetical protein ACI9UR_002536 [Bacteroidia bacterium]|jgi:hypothetical protein
MKLILPLLLITSTLFAQTPCEDFLVLVGQRDINKTVTDFQGNCGPFEESISQDGTSKTWKSKEKGVEITFVNRANDKFALPKFEVMMIELRAFTDKGGFKGKFPFGFTLGMDSKMVKNHIMELKSVSYEKKYLSKKTSSFTYTGSPNSALQNRQIKVYISQFDGKTITSIRLRLK